MAVVVVMKIEKERKRERTEAMMMVVSGERTSTSPFPHSQGRENYDNLANIVEGRLGDILLPLP